MQLTQLYNAILNNDFFSILRDSKMILITNGAILKKMWNHPEFLAGYR